MAEPPSLFRADPPEPSLGERGEALAGTDFTPVITNVNLRKQRQIIRAARAYRRMFGVYEMPFRFDVVTVLMPRDSDAQIDLVRGFWTESKFRKPAWRSDDFRKFS